MKNFIDDGLDFLPTGIDTTFIQKNYKKNFLFRWLRKPWYANCSEQGVLSHENLFYICFQFLDSLKQCNDFSDCCLQDSIQCIPYEVARFFELGKYKTEQQCITDRALVINTLYILLCILDNDETSHLPKILTTDLKNSIYRHIPDEMHADINRSVLKTLTKNSFTYSKSNKIMQEIDICEQEEHHLMDSINAYMISKQQISQEIAEQIEKLQADPEYDEEKDQLKEQIYALQQQLIKKDEQIAALKDNKPISDLPADKHIQIDSTCKSKVVAILSAMFYAKYFHGENGLSNRNQVLEHILQYGFDYPANSIPQLLSKYVENGGNLDDLKEQLKNTNDPLLEQENPLEDLTQMQNKKKKT